MYRKKHIMPELYNFAQQFLLSVIFLKCFSQTFRQFSWSLLWNIQHMFQLIY